MYAFAESRVRQIPITETVDTGLNEQLSGVNSYLGSDESCG